MKIYIASSWKNQHGVGMLTEKLRDNGFEVTSWIENNYDEDHGPDADDFEKWVDSESADRAFGFDTTGAMECDIFIYYGHGGKDAAAECGIAFARHDHNDMYALWSKGEDFGLMRKMFSIWFNQIEELVVFLTSKYIHKR